MVGVHVAKGDVAGGGVNPFGALHCTEYAGATVEKEVAAFAGAFAGYCPGVGVRAVGLSVGCCVADYVARRCAIGPFDASGTSQHYQLHKLQLCHEAVVNAGKGRPPWCR